MNITMTELAAKVSAIEGFPIVIISDQESTCPDFDYGLRSHYYTYPGDIAQRLSKQLGRKIELVAIGGQGRLFASSCLADGTDARVDQIRKSWSDQKQLSTILTARGFRWYSTYTHHAHGGEETFELAGEEQDRDKDAGSNGGYSVKFAFDDDGTLARIGTGVQEEYTLPDPPVAEVKPEPEVPYIHKVDF